MFTKRLFLALFAFSLTLPLSGCGCRRNTCDKKSFAPPPACCDKQLPPGYIPGPQP
jgi:hypothetical protein